MAGLADLRSAAELAGAGAAGGAREIAGGYAGIAELVRKQNADAAAAAVRGVQARGGGLSPEGQAQGRALAHLLSIYGGAAANLVPQNIRDELGHDWRNAKTWWENFSSNAPGPAALTAGIAGALPLAAGPEGRALEELPEVASMRGATIPESGRGMSTDWGIEDPDFPGAMSYRRVRQSVADPRRMQYPGIYKDPRELAAEAEARVGQEDPMLRRLWGVGRPEMAELARRQGNMPGLIPGATADPRGSAAAFNIMTPANTRRLTNALDVAQEQAPRLTEGMTPWYYMDPVYQRLRTMYDEPEAQRRYAMFNQITAMHSPGSPVESELARGTAAHMLNEQGRYEDWSRFGGDPSAAPLNLTGVPGHIYHSTSQAEPVKQYLGGRLAYDPMASGPKTGPYLQASSIPELGFQTDTAVGDTHWAGSSGLADVRTSSKPIGSVTAPEIQTLAPWWRENVAAETGLEAVPAQGLSWGLFGPQTGIRTELGAPKLELLSKQIAAAAQRMGVSPETARDLILRGEAYAAGSE